MALPVNRRASATGVTTVKAPIITGAQLREEITLIMAQAATGTAAGSLDMPVEVFANTDLNGLLGVGVGSPVNLAKESYFKADQGIKLHVLPVGDPGAGTAATGTITASTAIATKAIPINISAQGIEVSGVLAIGEDQDTAASLIKALLDTITRNPFTSAAAAGVVTTTAIAEGKIGNGISIEVYDDD